MNLIKQILICIYLLYRETWANTATHRGPDEHVESLPGIPGHMELLAVIHAPLGSFYFPGSNLPAHSRAPLQLICTLKTWVQSSPSACMVLHPAKLTVCGLIPSRSLLGESWLLHVGFCGKRTQRWGSALGCCEGGLWGSQPWTGRRPDPWPSLDQHIPSRHCWTLTSPASLQPLLPCPPCIHPFQLRRGTKQVAEEEPRNGTGETVREALKKNAVCQNISYKRGNWGESQYLTEWGCNWDTYIWKNVSHLKTLWRLFIIIQNIC